MRQDRQGLSAVMGIVPDKRTMEVREEEELAFVTEPSSFYCLFDTQDPNVTTERMGNELQQEKKNGRGQPIAVMKSK